VNEIHITKELKEIGLRYRKYNINDHYFDTIDTHNKAYVLGAFYSDGYLVIEGTKTKRIGIDSIDGDWLELIAKEMEFDGEIVRLSGCRSGYSSNTQAYRFKISSPLLYDTLIEKGCIEHKTNNLLFPNEEQVPRKFLNSFIAGFMDGDGSLWRSDREYKGKPYYAYGLNFTGTKEMLEGIQNYFGSNIKYRQRFPERKVNSWTITYSGFNTVFEKVRLLYRDTDIKMPRKYEKFLKMCQDSRASQ